MTDVTELHQMASVLEEHGHETVAEALRDAADEIEGMRETADGAEVLRSIARLRRDLSGYHEQLLECNDLQRHCDNQRKRIAELEELYAKAKAERDEKATAFIKEYDRAEFLTRERASLLDKEQRLTRENDELRRNLERMGNPYAKCDKLEAVIRRQREQLTEVQDALERRNAEIAELREGYDRMLRDRLRQEAELQAKAKAENERMRELAKELGIEVES